jgi:hypothetical protein
MPDPWRPESQVPFGLSNSRNSFGSYCIYRRLAEEKSGARAPVCGSSRAVIHPFVIIWHEAWSRRSEDTERSWKADALPGGYRIDIEYYKMFKLYCFSFFKYVFIFSHFSSVCFGHLLIKVPSGALCWNQIDVSSSAAGFLLVESSLVTWPSNCPLHIAGEDCPVCFEAWCLGLPGYRVFMQTLGSHRHGGCPMLRMSMEPSVQLVWCSTWN